LVTRITGIRKQASRDFGFIVPAVRIRDNLSLEPSGYRVTIGGVILADDRVQPGKLLAIQGGKSNVVLRGEAVKDPTFGLDAIWIEPQERPRAQAASYTVVDPSTVVATHFNQLLRQNAGDLLTQDEVQALLDHVAKSSPNLVTGLVPKVLSLSILTRVLKMLLTDQISISDMHRILECLASEKSREVDELVDAVRVALGPLIIQRVFRAHRVRKLVRVMRAAREAYKGRVIAVHQPHRYSRLASLFEEFAACFNDADSIFLAPVYAAGEEPIEGANAEAGTRCESRTR
jgi:flagellar biosynthesis protein FlhA